MADPRRSSLDGAIGGGPERVYFLGGRDLEMVAIRELLERHEPGRVIDSQLSWGARASSHRAGIRAALDAGRTPVLIELVDDLGPDFDLDRPRIVWVDHHGDRAGHDRPTSLEQVFALLDRPRAEWTRWHDLVAANDRGHVRALRAIGATPEEIARTREADRRAQGITPDQEALGREAAFRRRLLVDGRLAVVELPHDRTATVTDVLEPVLGGPGYANLLIQTAEGTYFFGGGRGVSALRRAFRDGYFGGDLPEAGYWGYPRTLPIDQVLRVLEAPLMTMPSTEIQVRCYHDILLWPILLRDRDGTEFGENSPLERWMQRFANANWNPLDPEPRYEVVVYFFPFVRDFLFGDGQTAPRDRALRRLVRHDVKQLRVTLGKKWPDDPSPLVTLTFRVDRVELYLAKPRTAVLVVEVSNEVVDASGAVVPQPLTLAQALDFQDQFRRQFPPFWWDEGKHGSNANEPGQCLRSLEWLDANGKAIATPPLPGEPPRALDSPRENFTSFTLATPRNTEKTFPGMEPPVYDHWRFFLGTEVRPVRNLDNIQGFARDSRSGVAGGSYFQQIMDERIPSMAYFAVDDPSQISQGDLDRIAFLDPAGTDEHPYNPDFLERERARHTYDRFSHYGTTYVCSGYGFAAVGCAGDSFYRNIVLDHVRNHYFHMGLMAHMQRATLLYFSEGISDAIKDLAGLGPRDEMRKKSYRDKIDKLQWDFLKFRSRGYFPEVTNQLQGRELYALWMDRLGTKELFDQFDQAAQRLQSALASWHGLRLSEVATRGVPIALLLSALSLLYAAFGISSETFSKPWSGWHLLAMIVLIVMLAVAAIIYSGKEPPSRARP